MGVEHKDYYKLLGLTRSASKDEISKAFKRLAKKCHPDLNPNNKEAEQKFKELNEAYEVLKDDEKRKLYNQFGENWQHGAQGAHGQGFGAGQGFGSQGFGSQSFGGADFFESFFSSGAGQQFNSRQGYNMRSKKGSNIESELSLTLEEAYQGGKKTVTFQDQNQSSRLLEINIPAKTKNGGRIRLTGQGNPGVGSGATGDLILKIHILGHPLFLLEENNVIYELNLSPWEAVLGLTVRIPTLDGSVDMNIPAGVSSNTKLRLKGRGLGTVKDKEGQGDQFIKINIKSPRELSEEEKALWEQIASISSFQAR